ncbi:MAG: alpha/beta hydrolase [Caldilineales bacterium]|nr:alpha/beta hydrolase [Caldilineales bacterium]MDW8316366.1 alpha/beta hydrolase [Anaerolineae bacterium]
MGTAYEIEHTTLRVNGLSLHVAQAGPASGPPVILLHGFPEFWGGWLRQMPALAAAGYRVWAPDQRGYNLSDKPRGVAAYDIDALAADVVGLIEATGHGQVALVGHDWGAAVAWWVAGRYPHRLRRLAILNVPHPAVMVRTVWRSPAQLRRSWYIFFFQLPRLPEASLSRDGWTNAIRTLKGSSRRGTFTAEDIERYRTAWSQPGAITAMINWYRAAARSQGKLAGLGRIAVPTLMIWGAQDIALGRELAEPSIALCDRGRLVFIEEAGHFVQHEEPERVNALLLEFLAD